MLRLSVLDQTLADVRAKKAKAAALLQNLDAPRLAHEALVRQEAQLEAERQQAEQEAAQLESERADLVAIVARFDTWLKDKDAGLRFLQNMVAICESGYLGSPHQPARVHALAMDAAAFAATLRDKLADVDARLKELDTL